MGMHRGRAAVRPRAKLNCNVIIDVVGLWSAIGITMGVFARCGTYDPGF